MIRAQARRTPEGEWVRVLGGWSPNQFAEKRLPTPSDLKAAAPDTPVIVTHLWDRIITNKAGLVALNIDRNTPNPEGGIIEKDAQGNPTGVIVAVSDWAVILNLISKLPQPASIEERMSSTAQFMRELNRLGITSVRERKKAGEIKPLFLPLWLPGGCWDTSGRTSPAVRR